MRRVGYRRVSHGLYLPLEDREDEGSEDAWLRELEAWLLVLPEDAVFTHLTGARLRRWRLPRLPDDLPVFVAVRGTKHPRRPGLVCARLRHRSDRATRHGLQVDSAEETLLRCAQDLGVLDLVILMDSALRCGDLEPAELERLLASRRPGVRRLRAAYRHSNPAAHSAGESVLRVFHEVCDIPVTPQRMIHDGDGNLIAQVDLLINGTTRVSEYDGEHHRDKRQHRIDLRRDRLFNGTDYTRNGYTLDDLLNHPASTLHELDRMLGRNHDARRMRRWRRLVEHSMYTAATRTRLMNRWRRLTGVVEWSGTA